jgi:hypothetical protein
MGKRLKSLVFRKVLFYGAVLTAGVVLLSPLFYLVAPGALGTLEAHCDLWRGHFAIYTLGLPAPGTVLIAKSLEAEGIEWRWKGCLIDDFKVKHAKAYNAIMKREIVRKFPKETAELAEELAW